ncbi:MAG TPA: 4-alpha-glucanotransferase [Anaeromyxobacteraceae bacterium]|nr:4-alpha-glucanotransferase [Anaeromyxobacteraceae bacterium]
MVDFAKQLQVPMRDRKSGILLHPTSLPGRGVGDLGAPARAFVEFLVGAGQRLWQVLPLGPTGYGDSPYQVLSAFAGNPLLVSLEALRERGWLDDAELASAPRFDASTVEYDSVAPWKWGALRSAARRFEARASSSERRAFDAFVDAERAWLDDFGLFMALKDAHGGVAWTSWDPPLARREAAALDSARRRLDAEIAAHRFAQYAFFEQWRALREHARERGVELMGDLPIYVAHDSAEVWAHRELFRLDGSGRPVAVAGVPPDYFSATGQLWGNPLYDWSEHERTGYAFWIARMRSTLLQVDRVRLDHFRGFEAFWEVPAGAATAAGGRWVPGPGEKLFDALTAALGPLPIVAENLGVITPEVEALRARYGYPGMAILQFAFGDDPQADSFKPHNYERSLVAYTGTHDNDTVIGWWSSEGAADSTRTAAQVDAEKSLARRYLATDGREMNWVLVRALLASVADTAILPLQDLLGLGSEARMNRPATASGNWRWRVRAEALDAAAAARLRELTVLYGRGDSSNQ